MPIEFQPILLLIYVEEGSKVASYLNGYKMYIYHPSVVKSTRYILILVITGTKHIYTSVFAMINNGQIIYAFFSAEAENCMTNE